MQEILDERKERTSNNNPKRKYLLSGLTRCGYCGKAFCGTIMTHNDNIYYTYKCNSREKDCSAKSINAVHIEEYIFKLFDNCLFRRDNLSSLTELVKICYIKSLDKIQNELLEVKKQIAKNKAFIKENEERAEQDEMKAFRKYIAEQNCQIMWETNELQHKQLLIEERLSLFPEFKEKQISQNVKNYTERLKAKSKDNLRKTLCELLHIIVIDNDKIELTINLHRLLNGVEPMRATIIENRDAIARMWCHYRQIFAFPILSLNPSFPYTLCKNDSLCSLGIWAKL